MVKRRFHRRALALIEAELDGYQQSVYRRGDLRTLFQRHRLDWGLSRFDTFDDFIGELAARGLLREEHIQFPRRNLRFMIWKELDAFQLPAAIAPHAFLSHYSALVVHDLTDDVPKTVYVAEPRRPRRATKPSLGQDDIWAAMESSPRLSSNRGTLGDVEVLWLEAEVPENVQVSECTEPGDRAVRVSTLERTLLDAVVRPEYGGGVSQLPTVFRRAAGNISVNRLVRLLRQLSPRFPYHQAIGFLLERAGYDEKLLRQLRSLSTQDYEFFIGRGQRESMAYDEGWRVCYPTDLPL